MSDTVAVKPVIDRDSFDDLIKLKAGQDFSINVKFFGEPPPKAKWTRGNKVLVLVVFYFHWPRNVLRISLSQF